jgi:phenylalanyl-tRNA synthetase beta chain
MKVSHAWLKAFVPHNLSAERVGELLSRHVATLDGIEKTRGDLSKVVVARVLASEKVPDTRLSFNKVDDGSGTILEVVCGAPNVTVGKLYPFARVGTLLPNGMLIEARKVRGMISHGMLCSADEIKLGTDHDGILELNIDVAPGTPLLDAMVLGDTVLDVDVLPNRPDLLSHQGVAREIAALTGKPMRLPEELAAISLKLVAPTKPKAAKGATSAASDGISVRIDDAKDCPRYLATIIRGVKVGPSPDWLRERVESIGGRSINNVVDATNYILQAFGQPVHAFDLSRIAGKKIIVRRGNAGEQLTTLDGTARKLDPSMLVIADAERASALAGIMGGKDSEVTDATTDVLLEVATFAPKVVRAGRRALGMTSDAAYRFERGIDDAGILGVGNLAAMLIASVSGGRIESLVDVGTRWKPRKPIALDPLRVSRLLGDRVSPAETTKLLKSVGFAVAKSGKSLKVTAPSWRNDVSRDVDLIEEIARLRGYDTLPDTIVPFRPSNAPDHPLHLAGKRVANALAASGFLELRSMPFTKGDAMGSESHARVANPLAEDEPFLRTTILDTLSRRAEHNLNRHAGDLRIFEVGATFAPRKGQLPAEEIHAAALFMGGRRPVHFSEPKPPAFDAWDAKAIGEAMARAAYPGRAISFEAGSGAILWMIRAGELVVGAVQSIALDAPVWASPAFGVELSLGRMPSTPEAAQGKHDYLAKVDATAWHPVFAPIPATPSVDMDLALIVPDARTAAEVEQSIRSASGPTLERVTLFDEYRGQGVPDGARSLAWRLTFRHPERTLREKEIEGRRAQLLKTLQQELGIVVRTG